MLTYQDGGYTVYCHENKIDGKRYFGVTSEKNVNRRWNNGKGYSGNCRFMKAIKRHGWENFSHTVLASGLSQEDAFAMEEQLIEEYNTTDRNKGYNISRGIAFLGGHHTEEAKKKISEARKRNGFTEEHKKHISESKQGVRHHHAKKVFQYSKDGEFIRAWSYMSEAANELGICKESISANCYGRRKSAGGYVWSYDEEVMKC